MSRSVPPNLIHPVAVEQFTLPQEAYEPIAAALGLHSLPLLGVQLIEGEVAVYKANRKAIVSIGVNRPSIGATIAAIKAALKDARKLEASLRRFTHRLSAVDQETFEALNPAANKCLEAIGQLRAAGTTRKEQLEKHRRLKPEREVLGLFFSRLQGHARPSPRKRPGRDESALGLHACYLGRGTYFVGRFRPSSRPRQ